MMADGSADYVEETRSGKRSHRPRHGHARAALLMLVDDGVVKAVNVEAPGQVRRERRGRRC